MTASNPENTWPSARILFDSKRIISDVLQVAFFLNASHVDCVPALAALLERIPTVLGSNVFSHYADEEGYYAPFSKSWLAKRLERMRASPKDEVTLRDEKCQVGSFRFHYFGRELPYDRWPGYRNILWFYIPRELVIAKGLSPIRDLIVEAAGRLPFSFGYAHPALTWHPGDAFAARRMAVRYPGFELLDPTYCRLEIDDRVSGVYWLSFLGAKLAQKLGGVERLRAQLPLEIRVEALAPAGILLQLGQQPSVGDVNREDRLPLYRALAQILKPHLYVPRAPFLVGEDGLLPDEEGSRQWHLRFFEGAAAGEDTDG